MENHDEPRAAATFSPEVHEAAAVITFLSPGLRFFHQGQFEGRRKRISPHLVRGPDEPIDQNLKQFYDRLLAVLRRPVIRDGQWQLLECKSAWDGNWTSDCFLASFWQGVQGVRRRTVARCRELRRQSESVLYPNSPSQSCGTSDGGWKIYWVTHDTIGTAMNWNRVDSISTSVRGKRMFSP